MTIYTFYSRSFTDDGIVKVAGVLDTKKKEITGDPAEVESLWKTIDSAEVDIQDEQALFRAFFDGTRLWIRKGKPQIIKNQVEEGFKRPSLRLVR